MSLISIRHFTHTKSHVTRRNESCLCEVMSLWFDSFSMGTLGGFVFGGPLQCDLQYVVVVCCSVLVQHVVALCCSVLLQCVAVWLRRLAICYSVLVQCVVSVHYSMLQCVTVCCSGASSSLLSCIVLLQRVIAAYCCSLLLQYVAVCVAACCSMLQRCPLR